MSTPGTAARNPYAPPKSQVEPPARESTDAFYTASTAKFVVLSLVTFDLYPLYWFYRNFKVIRERENSSIMPFWRAFFAPLWAYSCFRDIAKAGAHSWGSRTTTAGWLAFIYFVLNAVSRLPDPWGFASLLAFLAVMPPNDWAREYNRSNDPDFEENSRFTAANWIWIVVGGLIWTLALIGLATQPQH